MKTTIYLIGPTVGIDKLNLSTFNAVEGFLENQGYEVVKPHDLFDDWDQHNLTQAEAMARRQEAMAQCHMVMTMPGWHDDSYARCEYNQARTLCMTVADYVQWRKGVIIKRAA